ncbi:diguanylate cyclase [Colwellia asteriadis]
MMFRTFFILMLYCAIILPSHAASLNDKFIAHMQNEVNSSPENAIVLLQQELTSTEHSSETLTMLKIVLAQAYLDIGEFSKAQLASQQALDESLIHNNDEITAEVHFSLAALAFNQGNYLASLESYRLAHASFSKVGNQRMSAHSLIAIASSYTYLGELEQSLIENEKALKIMTALDDTYGKSQVYNVIGATYYYLANYKKAIEYYHYALNEAKKIGENDEQALIQANISEAYAQIDDLEKAIVHIKHALTLSQESERVQSQLFNLIVLGKLEAKQGEFNKAKQHFSLAKSIATDIQAEDSVIEVLLELAKISHNDTQKLTNIFSALEKAKRLDLSAFIRDAYQQLYQVYLKQENYKDAYHYFAQYHATNSDLLQQDNQKSLARLNKSLTLLKARNEIEQLKQNELISQAKNAERVNVQRLTIFIVVVITIIIITSYRRFILKRQASLLTEQVHQRTIHILKLAEMGKEITAAIEINKVASIVFEQLEQLFGSSCFRIAVLDNDSNSLHFTRCDSDGVSAYTLPLTLEGNSDNSHSVINSVLTGKESFNLLANKVEVEAILPLVLKDNIIGCIGVEKRLDNNSNDQFFSEYDLSILRSIASYVSVAVMNAMTLSNVKSVAYTDFLTQLPNRRALTESYYSLTPLNDRSGQSLCIAIADIDHFKAFNELHGHDGGDYVLREFSALLKSSIRQQDVVARWGGEEFVFILPNTDIHGAVTLLNSIREKLVAKQFTFEDKSLSITATFGVSQYHAELTLEEILNQADQALYQGKLSGRNTVKYFEDISML